MRDLEFGKELIKKKIPLVSNSPGVYRMLDKKGQVLYVGKAKNLPNRLKSYATDKNQTIRTERMLALTNNLEIVTTSSEAEALLLEANLIKKFNLTFDISDNLNVPKRYEVMFKDGSIDKIDPINCSRQSWVNAEVEEIEESAHEYQLEEA